MVIPGVDRALAQAESSLRTGDFEALLDALLLAWAEARAPELAAAIERVSDLLTPQRPAITALRRREVDEQWLERAASHQSADLGVLLPLLLDVDSIEGLRRLKQLRGFGPDPRIAARLCDAVLEPPFTAGTTGKFWTLLFELLLVHADPRVLARLEAAPGFVALTGRTTMAELLDRKLKRAIEALRDQLGSILELDAAARERLNALAATIPAPLEQRNAETLHAAILAEPSELGHRLVYADFLQARGDPRGEFIALQIQASTAPLDRASRARMNQLQHDHAGSWLAELGPVLLRSDLRFECGFLSAARVRANYRHVDRMIGHPLLATVISLEDAPLAAYRHEVMRSLRRIGCDERNLLDLLSAEHPLPGVRELAIHWEQEWVARAGDREAGWQATYTIGEGIAPEFRQALGLHRGLPNLRALTMRFWRSVDLRHFSWIWRGALGRELEHVGLTCTHENSDWSAAVLLASLRRASVATIARVTLEFGGLRWVFSRGEGEWRELALEGAGRFVPEVLTSELRALAEIGGLALEADSKILRTLDPASADLLATACRPLITD